MNSFEVRKHTFESRLHTQPLRFTPSFSKTPPTKWKCWQQRRSLPLPLAGVVVTTSQQRHNNHRKNVYSWLGSPSHDRQWRTTPFHDKPTIFVMITLTKRTFTAWYWTWTIVSSASLNHSTPLRKSLFVNIYLLYPVTQYVVVSAQPLWINRS